MSYIRLVQNLNEIKQNMATLDGYLNKGIVESRDFALGLIKRGTCFIAVKTEDGYRFYPSRFIGYYDNSMTKHIGNLQKDGKETNPQISHILGSRVAPNEEMEKEYISFCHSLDITPNSKAAFGVPRNYWLLK